jgi:hypothetical protein
MTFFSVPKERKQQGVSIFPNQIVARMSKEWVIINAEDSTVAFLVFSVWKGTSNI